MKQQVYSICLLLVTGLSVAAQSKKAHPYLYFTPDRIQRLKERVKSDTMMATMWNGMKARADQAVAGGRGGNAEILCLAYRMTGDTKYAQQAKTLLLQLVNKEAWDGMDDRTPRWNSGLGTSHSDYTASLVYDCIYDYLSKQERQDIAGKIVKLGIEPSISDWISEDKRIHSLNDMGHNWWSAVVFEAGAASLAVMNEVPQAKQWAEEIMRSSEEWFAFSGSVLENKPVSFDRDGGFYESIGYASYAVSEYLLFRLAWTNAVAPVKMPYDTMLSKTMDWWIHACYPTSGRMMSLNFGDAGLYSNGDKPVELMTALGFGKDRYDWYMNEASARSYREEMNTDPFDFVYRPAKKTVPAAPDLPASAIYKDMGWAMLRSSWNKNATMLGVKCGFTWNHAHADAGSFILFHNGKNLLIDGGTTNYAQDEYSDYFVRSEAHNVMLFNGKAQEPQDQYNAVKNVGHLYDMIDGGSMKYVLADATGPTSHYFLRNYRSFLWVGNVILVIDDIKTYEPGKFEFLLHFDKDSKRKGPDYEITNDSAGILFRPLFPETLPLGYPHDLPEKMRVEERQGLKDHDPKTKLTYYAFSPAEASRQTKFINAIILLDDKNKPVNTFTGSSGASGAAARSNLPVIERLEGVNYIGVRVTQDGKTTDVYFNLLADGRLMHRNSNNVIDGWETDAYIMAVSYPEKQPATPANATEYFISNGSYLRKDDRVILHSLSKIFMDAKAEGNTAKVILQGQPLMHVSLQLKDKPSQLVLNDKKARLLLKDDNKTMVLDIGAEGAVEK
ncbi:MAG TPA: heparinase II/III family protein [Chitinophagaceae bacterium]|jgi:hypothetical protein